MRTIIILLAIAGILIILRKLAKQSPAKFRHLFIRALAVVGIALFVFLLITGRLHWLFAVFAAALPVFYRLLPLLRHVPWVYSLYKRYKTQKQNTHGASTGQTSTVASAYLKMKLNHDSGDMDGEVLRGEFAGKTLESMSLQQLLTLLSECQHDNESAALLMAYLDRMHHDWRDSTNRSYEEDESQSQRAASDTHGQMSIQEAYEILGLNSEAGEQEIVAAHRRLMQKVHPDHGGSNYLAAKINLAKDILIKEV